MRQLISASTLLAFLVCWPAAGKEWARKMFEARSHDFGSVARDAKAVFEFPVKNIYGEDIRIAGVRSSCGCTIASIKNNKRLLKPSETGAIVARVNSSTFLGRRGATLTVTFDKPFWAQVQVQVKVHIHGDVVLRPGSVKLGSVCQGTAVEKSLEVRGRGQSGFRILEVRSANPHLSAKLVPAKGDRGRVSYRVQVALAADAPAGYIRDHLMLMTNDRRRPQIPVMVEGRVIPGISVGPSMLFLGMLQPGQKASKPVIVRGDNPFRIKGFTSEDNAFQLELPAEQAPKRVHVVPLTYVAGFRPGKVVRRIRIQTDLGSSSAEVLAYAMVADVVAQSDDESQTPLQPLNGDPPPLLQPPDDDSLLVEDEASDHLPPPRPILYDRPPYLQQFLENRLSARQSLQELLTRDQQSTLARAETPHDGEDSTQALRRESDSLSPRRRFPLGRLLLGRR